ncbi:MAG: hypothetical protein ABH817_02090 [archaeon]
MKSKKRVAQPEKDYSKLVLSLLTIFFIAVSLVSIGLFNSKISAYKSAPKPNTQANINLDLLANPAELNTEAKVQVEILDQDKDQT